MFYVKTNSEGELEQYPYTLTDLRRANPNVSFSKTISDESAASFGLFPVTPSPQPAYDYRKNLERTAIRSGDSWVEQWTEVDATAEEITARTQNQELSVRQIRNAKLKQCDWTQLTDSPLDADGKNAWALYRETLRMVPEQSGFPWTVVWPPEPTT